MVILSLQSEMFGLVFEGVCLVFLSVLLLHIGDDKYFSHCFINQFTSSYLFLLIPDKKAERRQGKALLCFNRKKQNISKQLKTLTMRPYKPQEQKTNEPLIIGYYPFRAKGQLARLICQYLHIKYVDRLFTPDQWSKYKETQAKDWVVKDLPFVQDGDFVVTGPSAISIYILERAGRSDLLGKNLADKIKIDSIKSKHDIKTAILGLICIYRPSNVQEEKQKIMQMWTSKVEPILRDFQNQCPEEGWYHGYLTVMDFFVYQLLSLISTMFPQQITKFNKLLALRERVGNVPEIKAYEASNRAVKEFSPVAFFSKYKEQMRMKGNWVDSHTMDLE